ncbi:hypothetical protein ACGFH8_25040 [Micromonospora sp. NPDC049175]|uniref:hypothetical protein n=1 Tax=Micromonospora sp. NPDC049175 TaxID=3364266 RepID=UPI0037211B99
MQESAPAANGDGERRLRTLTVVGVAANVLGVVTAVESVLRRDALPRSTWISRISRSS